MTQWGREDAAGEAPPGNAGYQGPPPTQHVDAGPQYPQPGYPPAQYSPVQYPPPYGYPPAYAYGYPTPLPYPPVPTGPRRPGLTLAACVLGYITAGFLVLAGGLLLLGASVASDIENGYNAQHDVSSELTFDGFLNLVAAGLLIAGAVMFSGRRSTGRTMFVVGNAIVLGEAIYWLARFDTARLHTDPFDVWAVIFAVLAVLPLAFSFTPDVNRWLRGEGPAAQPM